MEKPARVGETSGIRVGKRHGGDRVPESEYRDFIIIKNGGMSSISTHPHDRAKRGACTPRLLYQFYHTSSDYSTAVVRGIGRANCYK